MKRLVSLSLAIVLLLGMILSPTAAFAAEEGLAPLRRWEKLFQVSRLRKQAR